MIRLRRLLPGEIDHELIWGVIGLGLLAAAWAFPIWRPYYQNECPLKSIAGVPCALCGGTRSMHAWTRLNPLESIALNPLAALIGATLTLYVPYGLIAAVFRTRRLRIDRARVFGERPWLGLVARVTAAGALILNWAYVIKMGR